MAGGKKRGGGLGSHILSCNQKEGAGGTAVLFEVWGKGGRPQEKEDHPAPLKGF